MSLRSDHQHGLVQTHVLANVVLEYVMYEKARSSDRTRCEEWHTLEKARGPILGSQRLTGSATLPRK